MKRDLANPSHWTFNRVACDYDARPPYPNALIDRLCQLMTPGAVADLGAGTGFLSLPLAQHGFAVSAIEPSVAMRSLLPIHPELNSIAATAEATTLSPRSVDSIVAAEAAQWFQLEKVVVECRRILRPKGLVAAVEWCPSEAPHAASVAALLQQYNPKTKGRSNQPAPRWVQQTCRKPPTVESFAATIEWSIERFVQATRSYSYIGPALGPERLSSFEGELRSLLIKVYQGETFTEDRSIALYWANL